MGFSLAREYDGGHASEPVLSPNLFAWNGWFLLAPVKLSKGAGWWVVDWHLLNGVVEGRGGGIISASHLNGGLAERDLEVVCRRLLRAGSLSPETGPP